ncbi:MAG TPA: ABC transporter ATP-binding protein [Cellvibrionaceae bacterium]
MTQPLLQLDRIHCHYEAQVPVVSALTLNLHSGEIACLLGSSGCGKTTVLRAIAGFQPVTSGSIRLGEQIFSDERTHYPPEKRRVGMVFQDYALFPHLTVLENIGFGLRGINSIERKRTCDELLELVKLSELQRRYPHELSGGQQQRVALARALAPRPQLLLLDEPFSSLDAELRRSLAGEVRNILKAHHTSAIMVTHDQEEAFAFADKIGLMNAGRLEQWDTPFTLYHEPVNRYVADFIGQGAFINGRVLNSSQVETELGILEGPLHNPLPPATAVHVLLRPDDLVVDKHSPIITRIIHKSFNGAVCIYQLQLPTGSQVICAVPSHEEFCVGGKMSVRVEAHHLIVFERKD